VDERRFLDDGRTMVLEARQIEKEFYEGSEVVSVLKGVSLDLARGEIVALEGPSGSGKTTLLSIVGCIMTPSAGRVFIEGEEISADDPRVLQDVRRRSIGFVFQQCNLIPALTAVENVEYALNIKGLRGAKARLEAESAIRDVELVDKAGTLPRNLSGGQKQRVAIARALAGNSPILLVDEPTANLDGGSADQVLRLFRDFAHSQNRAVLVVTHDPKVRAVADRTLVLREGRLAA
jgi:putative ABC transport system ATP-binding protein